MTTLPKSLTKAAARKIAQHYAGEEMARLTASWDLMSSKEQRLAAKRLAKFLNNRTMPQMDPIVRVYYRSNAKVVLRHQQIGVRLMDEKTGKPGDFGIIEGTRLYRFGDMKNMMKSLDAALGGYDQSYFQDCWNNATLAQRAELIHELQDIDWDLIWKEEYNPELGTLEGSETSRIEDIFARMFPDAEPQEVKMYDLGSNLGRPYKSFIR